ncbi:MAG TPA: hypothetical protein VL021_08720 [Brumimicrobium sp.]|nr:hypothetical protein [Brumimicrobium sp.]
MKKWLFIVASFILFGKHSFSQVEVRPVIGVSEHNLRSSFFAELCDDCGYTADGFLGLIGQLGVSLNFKKIQLSILGNYRMETITANMFNFRGAFDYNNHTLGGTISTRLFNEHQFGLILVINGYGQIKTNYYLNHLDEDALSIRDVPKSYMVFGGSPYYVYHSRFYVGTPFVGSILTGVDFRAFDGFHITASVGFGLRIMKTKYAEWSVTDLYEEDVYEKLKGIPIETLYLSTMDFELGVRYAFPLKK